MDLVLDIGNTLQKAAVFTEDSQMVALLRQKEIGISDLEAVFDEFGIKRAIMSSVAGVSSNVADWLARNTNAVALTPECKLPIAVKYSTSETLGSDRIANAVGANALFSGQNVLSIMAGTCLVADFVNSKNEYLGGSISPGLNMRFSALQHFTARLPLVKPEKTDFLTGDSTKKSILSGVINGMVYEIEGFVGEYSKKYSGLKVILSGGDSEFFHNYIKKTIFAAQNPALLGLHKILLLNVPY